MWQKKKEKKVKKSYRSLNILSLGSLRSRSRGLSNRGGLGRFNLLDGGRGGSSFSGRHYNNRDKGELRQRGVRNNKMVEG
jgi:hypothetical protein